VINHGFKSVILFLSSIFPIKNSGRKENYDGRFW
jgi:hypothetical protein